MGYNWKKRREETGAVFKTALADDIFSIFLFIIGLIPLALCIYGTFFKFPDL